MLTNSSNHEQELLLPALPQQDTCGIIASLCWEGTHPATQHTFFGKINIEEAKNHDLEASCQCFLCNYHHTPPAVYS